MRIFILPVTLPISDFAKNYIALKNLALELQFGRDMPLLIFLSLLLLSRTAFAISPEESKRLLAMRSANSCGQAAAGVRESGLYHLVGFQEAKELQGAPTRYSRLDFFSLKSQREGFPDHVAVETRVADGFLFIREFWDVEQPIDSLTISAIIPKFWLRYEIVDDQLEMELTTQNEILNYQSAILNASRITKKVLALWDDKIQTVKTEWKKGTDLTEFNLNIKNKMTFGDAAKNTWTGRLLKDFGYKNARVVEKRKQKGVYKEVISLFTKNI